MSASNASTGSPNDTAISARIRFPGAAAPKPPVPMRELRSNRGFETVAVAPRRPALCGRAGRRQRKEPRQGPQHHGLRPRKPDGASFEFSVGASANSTSLTASSCPTATRSCWNGASTFRTASPCGCAASRALTSSKGATVDGEILLEADLLYQIDNMEGLSVTVDPDGTPRLTIVSDDNHSILQRNLLLEFRLVGRSRQAMQDG
jgi:hypothetical protein